MLSSITESQKKTVISAFQIRDEIRELINTELGKNFKYKESDDVPIFHCNKTENSLILYITNEGPLSMLTPIGKFYVFGISTKRKMTMTSEIMDKLIKKYNLIKIDGLKQEEYQNGWKITRFNEEEVPENIKLNKILTKSNWLKFYRIWMNLKKI